MHEPSVKFRAGAVVCAVWENRINRGERTQPMFKATVERRYRDQAGAWRSTSSFARNEIPLVKHVLQQAFAWMIEREQAGGAEASTGSGPPRPSAGPADPARSGGDEAGWPSR